LFTQCDVTQKEQVYKLAKTAKKEMGKVDILINNAGYVSGGEFLERPDADWERTIDVNLTALIYTTRAFLPEMYDRK
jgi:all-trans-retinol dehydrogenase (NAD+)